MVLTKTGSKTKANGIVFNYYSGDDHLEYAVSREGWWSRRGGTLTWNKLTFAPINITYASDVDNLTTQSTAGDSKMPVFNVVVTKKVRKFIDETKTESQEVERLLTSEQGIVATDNLGALLIAGKRLGGVGSKVSDEELSAGVTIKVTAV